MNDLISRQAAIDGILQFMPSALKEDATIGERVNFSAWQCAINCAESYVRTMPSAQRNRLEKAIAGKSPEEIYDFLYWLMLDYARTFTDSRAAVIAWLEGEEDG